MPRWPLTTFPDFFRDFRLGAVLRLRIWATHTARHNRFISEFTAFYHTVRHFTALGSIESSLSHLAIALRRTYLPSLRRLLNARLSPWVVWPRARLWRERQISWGRFHSELANRTLVKSLILKPQGDDGEKGVLYVSFEINWLRLVRHHDLHRLLSEYLLVGASSSSPPDYASALAFAHASPDPVFIQVSNRADRHLYRACEPVVRAIPIMACDWINPDYYQPLPHRSREIDILMVAGWAPLKGHRLLFRALKRMRRDLRVVLIGQDMDGYTADSVFAHAKACGVSSKVDIVRNASPELVTQYQCNSRTSVVLSLREGSSVVTTESFFADCPVAMLRDAHIGARAYINSATGVFSDPDQLHLTLSALVERSSCYTPRKWASSRITCFHTTARLNRLLNIYSQRAGLLWSKEIVPMCWRPDPIYVQDRDRVAMAGAYKEISQRHGITFRDHSPDT